MNILERPSFRRPLIRSDRSILAPEHVMLEAGPFTAGPGPAWRGPIPPQVRRPPAHEMTRVRTAHRAPERVAVIPRTEYVLSFVGDTGQFLLPLRHRIPSVGWKDGLLVVRVHAVTWLDGSLVIEVRNVSYSPDDPSVVFGSGSGSSPTPALADVDLDAAPLVGSVFTRPLGSDIGDHLEVDLQVAQTAGEFRITLSIDLIGRYS
jgi:hypothetical protein